MRSFIVALSALLVLATTSMGGTFTTHGTTVRGFGNSAGKVILAGPNEINDLKTITTGVLTGSIGHSPKIDVPVNASSKVVVLGPSYGGGHSFEIMRTHVPGLIAVMPIIGWSDLYQSLAPNDVPKLSYSLRLFASGFDLLGDNYADVMFDGCPICSTANPRRSAPATRMTTLTGAP